MDADEVQTLQLCAGDVQQSRGGAAIPVELRSHPEGGKEVLHAAALVHLTETLPTGESRIKARDLQANVYNNGGLYEGGHLFHGPAFQGLSSVDGAGNDLIAALVGRAPAPKEWIVAPMRNTWLADPLILDSSFQMMILWSFRQYGVGSLPSFLREYRQRVDVGGRFHDAQPGAVQKRGPINCRFRDKLDLVAGVRPRFVTFQA